jgi:hypothetical protein
MALKKGQLAADKMASGKNRFGLLYEYSRLRSALASHFYPTIMGTLHDPTWPILNLPGPAVLCFLFPSLILCVGTASTAETVRLCPGCKRALGQKLPLISTSLGGLRLLLAEVIPEKHWELLGELKQDSKAGAVELWHCKRCNSGVLEATVTFEVEKQIESGSTVRKKNSWLVASVGVNPKDVRQITAAAPFPEFTASLQRLDQ